jgi:hypothetical protein
MFKVLVECQTNLITSEGALITNLITKFASDERHPLQVAGWLALVVVLACCTC